jgi:hypothetical protein
MADNAFVESSSGMSNAQQGTRGLTAGDWVRLKRLRGAKTYNSVNLATNKDIVPPQFPQQYYIGGAINVFSTTGTSKIRRTASNYTDYIASQTADFVLSSKASNTSPSVTNSVTKLCNCATPSYSVKKLGICTKCNVTTHVRIM